LRHSVYQPRAPNCRMLP